MHWLVIFFLTYALSLTFSFEQLVTPADVYPWTPLQNKLLYALLTIFSAFYDDNRVLSRPPALFFLHGVGDKQAPWSAKAP
jgi:hypothetical protein